MPDPRICSLSLCCLVSACATSAEDNPDPPDAPVLRSCTSPAATDPYALGNVSIEDHTLLVHVQTGGGCREHSFAVCWDGSVIDTAPGTIDLALSHDANGDTCDASLSHDLRIDLAPVLAIYAAPLQFSVIGATSRIAGTSSSAVLDE